MRLRTYLAPPHPPPCRSRSCCTPHRPPSLAPLQPPPSQIKELLHSSPPAIPELSTRLGQLLVLLDRETKAVLSPHNNALDGSKPHIKGCISHGLGALRGCLAAVPRRVTVQYSAETQVQCGAKRNSQCYLSTHCFTPPGVEN